MRDRSGTGNAATVGLVTDRPVFATPAGQAFLVEPPGGTPGPGVLVLHSWWGLNDWTRDFCRRTAALGYTVVAPDLLEGENPSDEPTAERLLADRSPDELSGLVLSSASTVRALSREPRGAIGVIGFSMGASMALWLAARIPADVAATVIFYGSQSIDFEDAQAVFQGHFGDEDHLVSEDERIVTESFLRLGDNETEFHVYPGARHWFMEAGPNYDRSAAEEAFGRMARFLAEHLPVDG